MGDISPKMENKIIAFSIIYGGEKTMKQLSTDIYMVSSLPLHSTQHLWPLTNLNLCTIIEQSEKRGISVIVEMARSTISVIVI